MSRRREAKERVILPEPKYGSKVLAKFINNLMEDGKKSLAEKIVYGALEIVAERTKSDPLEVFEKALENASPQSEVKSRRVGGATYQVPIPVRAARRTALGMRWLVSEARKRREKTMVRRLANELVEAHEGRGGAVRKREDVHRMAEANRAFSHFRY